MINLRNQGKIVFSLLLFFYAAIRWLAWNNTVLLEDNDSVFYLRNIQAVESFDWARISALSADFTPFYPVLSALVAQLGFDTESAARFVSFAFAILLFVSLVGISRYVTTQDWLPCGLILVAVTPDLVGISYSVLTESAYLGTVYLGLWVFISGLKMPVGRNGALLGLIVGLAFLNRTEGIIYLAVFPFIQFMHCVFVRERDYSYKQLTTWGAAFVLCFSALAVPQIWDVSEKMDRLSLNGRQIHQAILGSDIATTNTEKMLGLNFSETEINFVHISKNTEILDTLTTSRPVSRIASRVNYFYRVSVSQVLGLFGIMFLGIGIFCLLKKEKFFEVGAISVFVGASLVPALITPQSVPRVMVRHIIVVFPILILIAAEGAGYLSRTLNNGREEGLLLSRLALGAVLIVWVAMVAIPLHKLFNAPTHNGQYGHEELQEVVAVLSNAIGDRDAAGVRVANARGYLPYYAGTQHLALPFADYNSLRKYLRHHQPDYVYIKEHNIKDFPFYEEFFVNHLGDEFDLIYEGAGVHGDRILLFQGAGS